MKQTGFDTTFQPKTALLAIDAPYNPISDKSAYFKEFESLVKTRGIIFDSAIDIKIREVDSSNFLTKGKLEEIRNFCVENKIKLLIVSEALTTQQERNLEDILRCEVIDRTRLILEIFENAALSAEGKAQVEIAILQFKKSRLAGKGIHMSQQGGGIGIRGGFGETAKEKEMRHIENQILKHKKRLKEIEKSRATQRKQRLERNVPLMSLIGYTNAGKSTILNTLTNADVLAEDKLFATLDTTTREIYVDGIKKGVISDTVGFIQQLPHQLIEAFKSTLAELQYSDLLLHVIDASDKNWDMHAKIVHEILEELEVEKPMLYIFNKVDQVENIENLEIRVKDYTPHVLISANTRDGIQPLKEFLAKHK